MAFTLRLSSALQKQAAAFAVDRGISLQALVSVALSEYLRVRRLEGVGVAAARQVRKRTSIKTGKRVAARSRVKRGS